MTLLLLSLFSACSLSRNNPVPKAVDGVIDLSGWNNFARNGPLALDRAVPCGLVLNELATNAIKYAFPGDRKGRFRLTIADDGIGLPANTDPYAAPTPGLRLVHGLVKRQLEGEVSVGNGTVFTIRFGAQNGEA